MPKKKLVIGVFAKTPGLSPLKTRLARTIGKNKAEECFKLSIECLRYTLLNFCKKTSAEFFFITAEKNSSLNRFWEKDRCIEQGGGPLGQRLDLAYKTLISDYENVIILGGDSPTIEEKHLNKTCELLKTKNFVIGPAFDGGFYLLAGRSSIDSDIWLNTPYSCEETFKSIYSSLNTEGEVSLLPKLLDIDEFEDLAILKTQLESQETSSFHKKLLDFVTSLLR